eukprot:TRINITY_DN4374_c0_g1_i1.p1 TRINITY_DN4374_c0_g1~~TRINITY_DN4374_c0_g1_i1.p1  ORF type:complete len:281 (-),score=33.57 TRINITY_DN4374_c0_g1_i1:17-859(-)
MEVILQYRERAQQACESSSDELKSNWLPKIDDALKDLHVSNFPSFERICDFIRNEYDLECDNLKDWQEVVRSCLYTDFEMKISNQTVTFPKRLPSPRTLDELVGPILFYLSNIKTQLEQKEPSKLNRQPFKEMGHVDLKSLAKMVAKGVTPDLKSILKTVHKSGLPKDFKQVHFSPPLFEKDNFTNLEDMYAPGKLANPFISPTASSEKNRSPQKKSPVTKDTRSIAPTSLLSKAENARAERKRKEMEDNRVKQILADSKRTKLDRQDLDSESGSSDELI